MGDRDAATMRVIEELKRIYKTKLLPLEKMYNYELFHSPPITDSEFDSKPQVLLLGQYSVGKTTFIRYLMGRDYPGQRIGPEPTTDRFVAVMDGPDERIIPGNALAVSNDLPYRGLEQFGVAFLNRFEGVQVPSTVLRNITLIDTPGVLSGEKQRVARGYDFTAVITWFAERCDLIILLFDAHKLDISDEFKSAIEALKGNDDKIRCILNKADQLDKQKLLRVYGALMWSMGKVVKTPEVLRVYVGSFWDQRPKDCENSELFDMEERDLMNDLKGLPRNSAVRKINELVKRVRIAKVHAYIISYLREQMPMFMGKEKKQKKLIQELGAAFRTVLKRYNLSPGDFPNLQEFQARLNELDFSNFSVLKQPLIDTAEYALSTDIPRLMEALPRSIDPAIEVKYITPEFDKPPNNKNFEIDENPFEDGNGAWALSEFIPLYQESFNSRQQGGYITGKDAKDIMMASGIPATTLRKVWDLADVDKDGKLSLHEFVIAMFLTSKVKEGHELPVILDSDMLPPDK